MTHALAKKIFDAGLAMKPGRRIPVGSVLSDDTLVTVSINPEWIPADSYMYPSAEDLMEALGDNFGSFERTAFGDYIARSIANHNGDESKPWARAEVLDEALGYLYVAIHTKPQ